MSILINIGCLCVGCVLGLFLTCAIVVHADDTKEHHITTYLCQHELKEHEWYWNDEYKKYYQIASSEEVAYAFNTINKNCVYVIEGERIKPIFYVQGVWFKYRESVVN